MTSIKSIRLLTSALIILFTSQLTLSKSVLADESAIANKPHTFNLKDGTIITGTIISQTETNITIMTRFGETTLLKSDLRSQKVTVTLKSGEVIIGEIAFENEEELLVSTKYGSITIFKNDISEIKDWSENTKPADEKFTFAEDYLIDVFQDPNGNTLKKDTVYISGLSLGYAFTDDIQISTRYDGFVYQNFNLRPKFRILNLGNWEQQLTASVGFHIHSNWLLTNFHKYEEGKLDFCSDDSDPTTCYYSNSYSPLVDTEEGFLPMLEVFAATTFAKTRTDLKGRYQATLGTSAKFVEGANSYRVYAGFDMDLNKRLKLVSEIFYDPFYDSRALSYERPDSDIYLDLGFIYTFTNNLSVGAHLLPWYVTVYWKQ